MKLPPLQHWLHIMRQLQLKAVTEPHCPWDSLIGSAGMVQALLQPEPLAVPSMSVLPMAGS